MFYYSLHIAVKQESIELVKILLNYKQKLDIELKEAYIKRTALHIVAEKYSTEIISLLLEKGECDANRMI